MESLSKNVIMESLEVLKEKQNFQTLRSIIPLLSHSDKEVKEKAAATVGAIIKSRLTDGFSKMDQGVRSGLIKLLTKVDPSIQNLVKREIYSPDVDKRVRAAQILHLISPSKDSEAILNDMISDDNPKVRATAIKSIAEQFGRDGISVIFSLLNDFDDRVKANTIEALEKIPRFDIASLLLRHKHAKNNRVRANVLLGLFHTGKYDIYKDLEEMITSKDTEMVKSALYLISKISKKEPKHLKIISLIDKTLAKDMRENILNTLVKIGTPQSDEYISTLFNISDIEEN